jgi:hypothetical protein
MRKYDSFRTFAREHRNLAERTMYFRRIDVHQPGGTPGSPRNVPRLRSG